MNTENFNTAPFIAQAKREIKSSNDVEKAFDHIRDKMRRAVDEVVDKYAKTAAVVPEISYQTVSENRVSKADIDAIQQRGCAIVRNVFSRQQAEDWNNELGDYLDSNRYLEHAWEKAGLDDYFGDLKDHCEPESAEDFITAATNLER